MSGIEKGTLWLFVSNIAFFLSSFLLYFFLGRFLLSVEDFGIFTVIISLVSVLTTTMTQGLQQSIAKFISASPQIAGLIRKKMIVYQTLIDLFLFVIYFGIADLLGIIFNDPTLVPFFRLSALLLLFHPLLGVIMGVFNGLKQFSKQAFFAIFFNILKMALILALVWIGWNIEGAIWGFVLASAIGILIGIAITRVKEQGINFSFKPLFYFAIPMIVFTLMLNLLQNIDLFAVKALSAEASNALSGNYSIAATLARIPATLILAVSTVALPLISETIAKKNLEKTRFYIKESVRYSLLFLVFCAAIIAAKPDALVELIFSSKYMAAHYALFILAFAYVFFGLFQLLSTIIAASGQPQKPLIIAVLSFVISFALNQILIILFSIQGAAIASLIAMFIAFALSAGLVLKKFKALVSIKSAGKIFLSGLLVFTILSVLGISGLLLIPAYIAMLLLYAACLFVLKEIKRQDIDVFFNMIK